MSINYFEVSKETAKKLKEKDSKHFVGVDLANEEGEGHFCHCGKETDKEQLFQNGGMCNECK